MNQVAAGRRCFTSDGFAHDHKVGVLHEKSCGRMRADMSSNLPELPPQELTVTPQPEKRLTRTWHSLKTGMRFVVHTIGQEYAESGWYKLISTTLSRTNKLASFVAGSSLSAIVILCIYTNREFLLLNKRWVAIVVLSVLTMFLLWVTLTVRRFHERTVGELGARHQEELKALKATEKRVRFKLYQRWKKAVTPLVDLLEPRVSIECVPDEPSFVALKTIRKNDYRVWRVRVTNTGGEPLYNLKAQLRLTTQHYSYSDIDLTLKEEDLPIIQHHIVRRDTGVLPRPRTSFDLHRGERQFVNVAMQGNEGRQWSGVTLCLSHIGADNYSNSINVQEPIEFRVVSQKRCCDEKQTRTS